MSTTIAVGARVMSVRAEVRVPSTLLRSISPRTICFLNRPLDLGHNKPQISRFSRTYQDGSLDGEAMK